MAIPMRGRMIHSQAGQLTFQPYSKDPNEAINSVSRGGLNLALVEAAEAMPNVRVRFEHRCVDIDPDTGRAELESPRERVFTDADLLIGADGAFSAVRARLQRQDRFDYSQDYLAHGYKELTIPPGPSGEHRMERNALHIWARQSFMMIALPNIDGSFTCTLFCPFEGPASFASIRGDADVLPFFNQHFPDAVPHMPTLVEDYRTNPTSSLVTVRCHPYHVGDRVVLLGDAAHAVVPFYGQGMNAAFEDCAVLNECLQRHGPNRAAALREYDALRKENADALADLAVENFIEMRDKTASRFFRLKKKTEQTLHKLLPGWYVPLYSMVSFSRIPYAEAVRRARRQNRIVRNVAVAVLLIVLLILVIIVWR
jgi:kynurenine 3-monooxygenase